MSPSEYTHSILVLEDEPDLADFIASHLRVAGFDVTVVPDGAEALAVLEEELPDLIVSDVVMPTMNGLEFLQELRKSKRTNAIPLIFLTTESRVEDVIGGLSLGADDYMVKPFKPSELVARIRSKLARPPVPLEDARRDVRSGLLSDSAFLSEVEKEHARARRGNYSGIVACMIIPDLPRLRTYFGPRTDRSLAAQLGGVLMDTADPLVSIGRNAKGDFLLLQPGLPIGEAAKELKAGSRCPRSGSGR